MKRLGRIAVVTAALVVSLYGLWCVIEFNWFVGIVPANLKVSYPMHISGESGFREGCGIAVFRIERETAKRIETDGVRFLNTGLQSRNHLDTYHTFETWRPTPDPDFVGDDKTMLSYGLACSSASSDLWRLLEEAARESGSYYARGPEKVLLVMPKERIVVLAYFG